MSLMQLSMIIVHSKTHLLLGRVCLQFCLLYVNPHTNNAHAKYFPICEYYCLISILKIQKKKPNVVFSLLAAMYSKPKCVY